jgi:decaprenylphospho-beta-D-ribofuranose 2-oxidase
MYPRLDEWRRVRDAIDPERVFVSDLARRLRLVDDELATARR